MVSGAVAQAGGSGKPTMLRTDAKPVNQHGLSRAPSLALALAMAGCALLAPQVPETSNSAPAEQRAAVRDADPQATVSTQALELDGEVRVSEPIGKLGRRPVSDAIDAYVMPLQSRYHPRLASDAQGSMSVGTVTAGYLVDAAEVPVQGEYHRVLDKVVPRQTRYTTDDMRDLLLCAAERVAKEHKGAILQLGNLSRPGGGPLPWSVSHHNGRDADLAFYVRDSKNKLALTDRLYHFDARGKASDAPESLTFDPEANWSLVAALLECKGPELQHLFVAEWLKQKMLAVAVKKKADKKLLARANALLHQPKKTLAHNDHLHLRIGCDRGDFSEGCVNASRAPQAAWGHAVQVRERFPSLRKALHSEQASDRAAAVYLLAEYRDSESYGAILDEVRDRDPQVRLQAVRATLGWGGNEAVARVRAGLAHEDDPRVAIAAMHGLASLGETDSLAGLTRDPRQLQPLAGPVDVPTVTVRQLAAALLATSATLDVAPALVELLDDADPAVRDTARLALSRLTNHDSVDLLAVVAPQLADFDTTQPLDPVREKQLWRVFLAGLPAGTGREELALQGLLRRGIVVAGLDRSQLPALVQALALPSPWRDNASEWIGKIVSFAPAVGRGARANPLQFWAQWLVQRRMVAGSEVAIRLAGMMRPTAALGTATPAGGGTGAGGVAADQD